MVTHTRLTLSSILKLQIIYSASSTAVLVCLDLLLKLDTETKLGEPISNVTIKGSLNFTQMLNRP